MNNNMKEKIMAKATELFSEQGYDSVGIAEIVNQCSITKPTLYYYFGSKENLLQSIVHEYCLTLKTAVINKASQERSFEKNLASTADAYLKYTSENKQFMRLYFSLVFTPHSNRAYHIVKQEAEAIQAIIETFFENDLVFGCSKSFIAVSFIGQLNTFSTLILNNYIQYSEQVSKQMLYLFLNGIRSPKK